jgi:signal transduction histidine kinase
MELSRTVELDQGPALLRLGMRLDDVHAAERRMVAQLTVSLLAAVVLAGLGLVTIGLRRRYGQLSERHEKAEEALRRRDRLAAMGELASTVAHEVRNPLNAIAMSARRLRSEFTTATTREDDAAEREAAEREAAERDELLAVLESETQRINRIVQQFLDFARPPKLDPTSRTWPSWSPIWSARYVLSRRHVESASRSWPESPLEPWSMRASSDRRWRT